MKKLRNMGTSKMPQMPGSMPNILTSSMDSMGHMPMEKRGHMGHKAIESTTKHGHSPM